MLYKLCLNELEHFKVFSRLFRTAIMLGTGLGPAGLGVLDTLWPDGHLHIRDSQWRCPGGNNEWSSIYQYGKCQRYLGWYDLHIVPRMRKANTNECVYLSTHICIWHVSYYYLSVQKYGTLHVSTKRLQHEDIYKISILCLESVIY